MEPVRLRNIVKNYSWGTEDFIPGLLGEEITGTPCAELWMGTHKAGESEVLSDSGQLSLSEFIAASPVSVLGEVSGGSGGELPFLFKVLSAGSPLSIQAHPDLGQAREGFSREEKAGIPVESAERNYRDSNHKPEILCAVTPFRAMCGFRSWKAIEQNFRNLDCGVFNEFLFLQGNGNKIEYFFKNLMTLPEENLKELIDCAVAKAADSDTVEAELITGFYGIYKTDPGVLAPLFLNIIDLKPGEAVYQGAGILHAYVRGSGIELMANSDNVLRGGLTSKHMDVKELVSILDFSESSGLVLHPARVSDGIYFYETPAEDFLLGKYEIRPSCPVRRTDRKSVEILLCTEGECLLSHEKGSIEVRRGDSILVPADISEYLLEGSASIFSAGIPEAVPV